MMRPEQIAPVDWYRMSWYSRQRAYRHLGLSTLPDVEESPERPQHSKLRIHKTADGWWEITNGVSIARTTTVQAAWALVARMQEAS